MRQPLDTRRPIMPAALMPFAAREEATPPIEVERPSEEVPQERAAVRFWRLHFGKPLPRA